MQALEPFSRGTQQWSLEEFVRIANHLIPLVLSEFSDPEVEEINPRLVRYYATQGLMDKPLKEGRESRYLYRHLLQLLVVRRLLAEGYSTGSIISRVITLADEELEALLQGGLQLSLEAPNPALSFLQSLQKGKRQSATPSRAASSKYPIPSPPLTSDWSRIEIAPGLELHIRNDFQWPSSSQERQSLINHITQLLVQWMHRRRKS